MQEMHDFSRRQITSDVPACLFSCSGSEMAFDLRCEICFPELGLVLKVLI